MSGAFFGVYEANARPASTVDLQAMDHALASWGTDGAGQHCAGPLGLGARLLQVTAEDDHEVLPLIDGPHRLVARVRLDNRRELCAKLGLTNSVHLPDTRLILEAYRKYGHDCVQHLMGDWSFALWDDSTQTLLIARDASGNTGVYYNWNGRRLAFANGIKGILALPGFVAEIEPLVLAGILTVYVDPEVADGSIYKGIKKLLPGCLLLARNGRLDVKRWWQPEALEPLRYRRISDCYEEFVALYDEVVGECLRIGRGSVAATLSGGLDSGSVVSLAAPRLQDKGQMLTAFVHAPFYEPTLAGSTRTGDELALAQQTADHVGNTNVVAVRSQDKTLLWGMKQALDVHDMPGHAADHFFWLFDIQQQARSLGAKVLLTGQVGNATVSYAGHGNLWPHLWQGHWGVVAHALLAEQAGLWLSLKRRIIKPVVWPMLSQWRRWCADGHQPWSNYSYMSPDLADNLGLRQRMRVAGFDPTFATAGDPQGARMRKFRLGLNGRDFAGANWMESGAAHGLDVRDPTRDRRIVEFCWRAPDEAFWAQGKMRGLIRQGMARRLPGAVLYCRAKGLQSADALARYRTEAPYITELLETAGPQGLAQWLDVARMRRDLKTLSAGGTLDPGVLHGLGRAVQTALFLQKATTTSLRSPFGTENMTLVFN
jgi:asparagine synthase (glutamine-hydrolysing)